MKSLLTVLVLVAISGGVFALGTLHRGSDDKPILHVAEEVAVTVEIAKPERRKIIRLVEAPGDVEAVLEVEISSEIVSKIEEMPIEEGDFVKRGDLLCRLDDDQLRAEVESAEARIAQLEAAIRQVEADLEKAERDCSRQEKLSESSATSQLEMQDYLTVYKKAKALVEMRRQERIQAQAILTRMKEDLKRTVIVAPIDGVISRLRAKQGEVVITGTMNNPGTVIMTISDLSKMQVRARVDEIDVPYVAAGQKARVYLQSDPDKPVPARVIRVASKGTRPTGRDVVTFETLLEILSDDARIRPGMTANVEIEVAYSEGAITVPVEAVVHRMRKDLPEKALREFDSRQADLDVSDRVRQAQYIKVVYVKDGDHAKVRLVESGIADTRSVELCSGVEIEDDIIIGPYRSLDQLKDGKKVAIAKKEPHPGEAGDKPSETEGEGDEPRSASKDNQDAKDGQSKEETSASGDTKIAAGG